MTERGRGNVLFENETEIEFEKNIAAGPVKNR